MRCPFCGSEDTQVKDSRPVEESTVIRRRRQCSSCGARFTTFERVQLRDLIVLKKDGRRSPFDREKLLRSIRIAARKRGIDEEQLEQIVNGIVRRVETTGEFEVPSKRIGELAMESLAKLDEVAYVRFASVYRDFATVNEVYASYFEGEYPARSAVQAGALPGGFLVEIEVVAAR